MAMCGDSDDDGGGGGGGNGNRDRGHVAAISVWCYSTAIQLAHNHVRNTDHPSRSPKEAHLWIEVGPCARTCAAHYFARP
jgi:hypothetical protein